MSKRKTKVLVNARLHTICEKLLEKIDHLEKFVEGIGLCQILEEDSVHLLRLGKFKNRDWQKFKESNEEAETIDDKP